MSKCLSWWTRKRILIRDGFECRKCHLGDRTGRQLQVHHIRPRYLGGPDDAGNLITLCLICHKYAPDNPDKFSEYMRSDCDGQLTILVEILKEARESGNFPDFVENNFCKII